MLDWLDDRTGYRAVMHRILDEPLPAGVGWWFTTGSVLLLLLGSQLATGIALMFYYVPSPDHAWHSVRFVMNEVTFGRLVRNLHFFGASFIVVLAAVHLLRVFFFGSYKRPREATWISGVVLLLVIMGFALTGYLLPWDQRAYWATVVTINIARSAPGLGEFAATLMRGGPEIGALTLSRWYAVHVVLLPGALLTLVGLHLALMRRHGISGPVRPVSGPPKPFFPGHAVKDALVGAGVFVALLALVVFGDAPLEPQADPADASYTPRPEWYFLWLFQMLKYFPGKLELLGAHGIPALLVGLLLLLPFLDRREERRFWKRPIATTAALAVLCAIGALTLLGLRDVPAEDVETKLWRAQALGGQAIAESEVCTTCHRPGGAGAEWPRLRVTRDEGWIKAHAADPEWIAPGSRQVQPRLSDQEQHAVVAYARVLRGAVPPPAMAGEERDALALAGRYCLGCHVLDGDGRGRAPNLSRAGRERSADWLAEWITDPTAIEYDTDMPAFGGKLTPQQIRTLAAYLATRK
jgi:ubiquinol-cytochrome c reductase cytochrome b subunit